MNKFFYNVDAELIAIRHGIRDALVDNLRNKTPKNGSRLNHCATTNGVFVMVTKKTDGSLTWLAMTGESASSFGEQISAYLLATDNSTDKLPPWFFPTPDVNEN